MHHLAISAHAFLKLLPFPLPQEVPLPPNTEFLSPRSQPVSLAPAILPPTVGRGAHQGSPDLCSTWTHTVLRVHAPPAHTACPPPLPPPCCSEDHTGRWLKTSRGGGLAYSPGFGGRATQQGRGRENGYTASTASGTSLSAQVELTLCSSLQPTAIPNALSAPLRPHSSSSWAVTLHRATKRAALPATCP